VVLRNINGVDHGETPFIAGHQDVLKSLKCQSLMLVASEIREEEHSNIISVIISLAKIASRKLRHEDTNMLVFNTEDNALLVTNSDMTRDQTENVT